MSVVSLNNRSRYGERTGARAMYEDKGGGSDRDYNSGGEKTKEFLTDQFPAVLRCCHHGLVGGLLANDPWK